ncbi:MAG: hypothetical protein AAF805_09455 [Planctomycetota bacterium]
MKSRLAVAVTVVIALSPPIAAFAQPAASGVNREGQGAARLTIDGAVYNVPIGKPFALVIDGRRRTVRIDAVADREFRDAGIAFRYPAAMELTKSDADAAVTVWTVQGRSAAILLQRYAEGIDAASLAEVLVQNLVDQAAGAKKQDVQLRGAERAYRGAQVLVPDSSSGQETVHNVFAFDTAGGVFALLIQDTRPAGGEESPEYAEALRLMGESFRTGPAPAAKTQPGADPANARPAPPRRAPPRGFRR